jgi:hypothetical protein
MSATFGEMTGLAEAHLRAAARESVDCGREADGPQLVGALVDCVR